MSRNKYPHAAMRKQYLRDLYGKVKGLDSELRNTGARAGRKTDTKPVVYVCGEMHDGKLCDVRKYSVYRMLVHKRSAHKKGHTEEEAEKIKNEIFDGGLIQEPFEDIIALREETHD